MIDRVLCRRQENPQFNDAGNSIIDHRLVEYK